MTVVPYLIGLLVDKNVQYDEETDSFSGNYTPIHVAFIGLCGAALVIKIGIFIWDIS